MSSIAGGNAHAPPSAPSFLLPSVLGARTRRKHTGERPFRCHCLKAFSRLDNLRQHAQTVHADTPERNEEMMQELTALHSSLAKSAAQNQVVHQQVLGKAVPSDIPPNQVTRKGKSGSTSSAAGGSGGGGGGSTTSSRKRSSIANAAAAHGGFPGSLPHHLLSGEFGAGPGGSMAGKGVPRSNSMTEATMTSSAPFAAAGIGAGPPVAHRALGAGAYDPLAHRHSIANHHIPPLRGFDVAAAAAAAAAAQQQQQGQVPDHGEMYGGAAAAGAQQAYGGSPYDLQAGAGGAPGPQSVYFGYENGAGAAPGAAAQGYAPQGAFSAPGYDVYGNPVPGAGAGAQGAAPTAGGGVGEVYPFYPAAPQPRANSYHATTAWNGDDGSWRRDSDATGTSAGGGPYSQPFANYGPSAPSTADRYGGGGGVPSYAAQPNYSLSNSAASIPPFGGGGSSGVGQTGASFSPFATRPNSSHGILPPSRAGGTAPGSPSAERPILPPLSSLSRPGTAGAPPGTAGSSMRDSFSGVQGILPGAPGGPRGSFSAASGSGMFGTTGDHHLHHRRLSSRGGSRGDVFDFGNSLASYGGGKSNGASSYVEPPRLPSRSGLSNVPSILSESRSRRNSFDHHRSSHLSQYQQQHQHQHANGNSADSSHEPSPFRFHPPLPPAQSTLKRRSQEDDRPRDAKRVAIAGADSGEASQEAGEEEDDDEEEENEEGEDAEEEEEGQDEDGDDEDEEGEEEEEEYEAPRPQSRRVSIAELCGTTESSELGSSIDNGTGTGTMSDAQDRDTAASQRGTAGDAGSAPHATKAARGTSGVTFSGISSSSEHGTPADAGVAQARTTSIEA